MENIKTFLFVLIASLLLSGCAAKQDLPRFVWPAPPDKPRLEFIGNYYSKQELASSRGNELVRSFLGKNTQKVFSTPFGIVSDGQGRVYISDLHLHNVWVFDFNLRTATTISKASLFDSPAGMALDKAGNLFVADSGKGRILKFSAEHKLISNIEGGGMEAPTYLALSPDNRRLYVSESRKHRILVFDADSGKLLREFGKVGIGEGEFNHPQGLAFGPDGQLYVVDSLNSRIQVFDFDGSFIASFGERGDRLWQLESPKDLAFDSDGNLYVVESRSSVVKTFTAKGEILLVTGDGRATSSPFGFSGPKSIFIDQLDRIFVAETLGRRFTIWQYMSDEYLKQKPFTSADRQKLLDYMDEVASGGK